MKRKSIRYIGLLGIVTIFTLVLDFGISLGNNWQSFQQGWEDGMESTARTEALHTGKGYDKEEPLRSITVPVKVLPLEEQTDSLCIKTEGRSIDVPYQFTELSCRIETTPAINILMLSGGFIVLIVSLYGLYCLIRVLTRILKEDVFSRRNVWWLRWIAYGELGLYVWNFWLEHCLNQAVLEQVSLSGYQVMGVTPTEASWSSLTFLVLLTEIYAIAVKIKEEQDLTI